MGTSTQQKGKSTMGKAYRVVATKSVAVVLIVHGDDESTEESIHQAVVDGTADIVDEDEDEANGLSYLPNQVDDMGEDF